MTMTATICPECHLAPARFAVVRPHEDPSEACDVCAAKLRKLYPRAKLSRLDVEGTITVHVEQPDLYGGAPKVEPLTITIPAHVKHSATSLGAAQRIAGDTGTLRARVLTSLRDDGPASDEQLQDRLGMNPSTERPRRVELCDRGLVEQVGEERTRSGRKCALWGVTERGRA